MHVRCATWTLGRLYLVQVAMQIPGFDDVGVENWRIVYCSGVKRVKCFPSLAPAQSGTSCLSTINPGSPPHLLDSQYATSETPAIL